MSAFNGNGAGPGFDVIVVGGGHNALTAAAYLQRAGLRTCVLEARDILGGACVTEELWPGQRVSRASYVVSMLRPKVVADLELTKFGYDPIPLDPEFATFAADGRPMLLPNDDKVTYEQVARVSRKDADALIAHGRFLHVVRVEIGHAVVADLALVLRGSRDRGAGMGPRTR